MSQACRALVLCAMAVSLAAQASPPASEEPDLQEAQIRHFLLTAEIVRSQRTAKGITAPLRLTLTDGTLTHEAAFQSMDERKPRMRTPDGRWELNFRDSFEFNLAAYELAKLVGLGEMVPVTVERSYQGRRGALSWWVPAGMDEADRQKQNISPSDRENWNQQMNRIWVFSQLIYDTDRNQTNVLITKDWKLFMIDFTRAFRPVPELEDPKKLQMGDRKLLARLRALNERKVRQRTRPYLSDDQVKAIMARRDRILEHFERLVRERGEETVLYGEQPETVSAAP